MSFIREITQERITRESHQANARATVSCSLDTLSAKHPCFALGRPNNKGRIHLPVSPGCNIACRFCERSINRSEKRPGVTAEVLKPAEAIAVIEQALELAPELTVAGIAGPGDTLATPWAFKTFQLVKERFPQMLRCMSTNGLLLADKIDQLVEVGIDTLTVTVNEVLPERLALINDHVVYRGRRHTGVEAAEIL
ncbi:MAG: radical SAM protein, partial [Coriobacteriales bacterium]|nr:radical SAM protein [Coriobacteriales bacterium]